MQPGIPPFGSTFPLNPLPFLYINGQLSGADGDSEAFDSSRLLFLASLWLFQGAGGSMDLSKVGEKILSSVRSARSLGFLPSSSSFNYRPEVPARVAAAAAVARALASLPHDQKFTLPSSSEELSSIYGSRPHGQPVEELEEEFYEEEYDPVRHALEQIPDDDAELEYFQKKATIRLAQLDSISERLSRHVMEHHEEMVKGMHLVRELERDLKIATVICMNGRRHLTSSMNELSKDLIVTTNSKRKQALLDMLPILTELCHALDMQKALERHIEEGDYCKAFQVLSEYLQLLDSLSELSAIQEMSRGVEVWLGKTLQKLDSLLLQVCQEFKEEKYITVVDAYALIGDVSGLAEKIQSYFMQEVLSETHSVLKTAVQEDQDMHDSKNSSRLTYSDLCQRIPESKFRICLIRTLSVLFNLMSSFDAIMSFQAEDKLVADHTFDNSEQQNDSSLLKEEVHRTGLESECSNSSVGNGSHASSTERMLHSSSDQCTTSVCAGNPSKPNCSPLASTNALETEKSDEPNAASISGSPWFDLRKDAMACVSQSLERGRKNLWQLTTSRVSVLVSSSAFCSTSIHQFLKNYEDLNVFILAGETFCGVEAFEFRSKLKAACENYFFSFHRQNIHALKMVLEKENWQVLPLDVTQVVSFAGLVGDGAPLLSNVMSTQFCNPNNIVHSSGTRTNKSGFSHWVKKGNPFAPKVSSPFKDYSSPFVEVPVDSGDSNAMESVKSNKVSPRVSDANLTNGTQSAEDENEDLLADFIDEDSQLPSRISKPSILPRALSTLCKDNEGTLQTGSSLCLLRFMDKYARLMQKLQIANVELFKGMCQLFGVYFHFIFETFGQQKVSFIGLADSVHHRLKTALNRITHECEPWIKSSPLSPTSLAPTSLSASFNHVDVTPTNPPHSFGLKERCTGADTISLVARVLHRSKSHLQSMLLQHNAAIVEDFFANMVDSVPDLIEHVHRTTARLLLHIDGYVDRIANTKWELKELGMEHNGYVDLLLGEFKHYKTQLAHGGIHKEVQDTLLEYGVEIIAETLVEGLSRVKRCTDEGRALMSLDIQVLINGLQHFSPKDVKPKLHIAEAFIKAYYLPETEYVHWARAHPEYTKNQVIGLVNLVATMKGWKRKTKLEVLEKIE